MTIKENLKFEPEWYQRIIENSNEKIELANFIKDTFLREKVGDLLEVGMGTKPIFSNILSEQVHRYTIVERESISADLFINSNVKIITGDFEVASFDSRFDFIILSHVIYYFLDLKTAISRALKMLKKNGKLIFVVNEINSDYARVKRAFTEITGINFIFTCDLLMDFLRNYSYKEYSLETHITFSSHSDLYSYLQLFFDLFPNEYLMNEKKITNWLENNIHGNKFFMNQKVITVTN